MDKVPDRLADEYFDEISPYARFLDKVQRLSEEMDRKRKDPSLTESKDGKKGGSRGASFKQRRRLTDSARLRGA